MADKELLSQMLEHLVNEDQEKAEELFHEYVVGKSREIYESLIEEEMEEDEEVDEAVDDEEVDESTDDEEVSESSDDEEVDENFEDVAFEADDEDEMDMGGDETDDLAGELDGEEDEEGEKDEAELFQDLDAIVDELQAKFDELKGHEEEEGELDGEEEGEEEMEMDSFDAELATVREYVEKVAGGHGAETKGSAESADNKKSVVDNMKNDMGGTTANIAKGGEDSGKNDGGLADINAKEDNAGNVNVPGSKNATKMSNEKGHGAEKKGAAESADNTDSIFRGRR
jgi:pilus assembly protein FimV